MGVPKPTTSRTRPGETPPPPKSNNIPQQQKHLSQSSINDKGKGKEQAPVGGGAKGKSPGKEHPTQGNRGIALSELRNFNDRNSTTSSFSPTGNNERSTSMQLQEQRKGQKKSLNSPASSSHSHGSNPTYVVWNGQSMQNPEEKKSPFSGTRSDPTSRKESGPDAHTRNPSLGERSLSGEMSWDKGNSGNLRNSGKLGNSGNPGNSRNSGSVNSAKDEDEYEIPNRDSFSGRKIGNGPKFVEEDQEVDDDMDENALREFLDSNPIFLNSFVDEFVDEITIKNWIHDKSPRSKAEKKPRKSKVNCFHKSAEIGSKAHENYQCEQQKPNCPPGPWRFEMPCCPPLTEPTCSKKRTSKKPKSVSEEHHEVHEEEMSIQANSNPEPEVKSLSPTSNPDAQDESDVEEEEPEEKDEDVHIQSTTPTISPSVSKTKMEDRHSLSDTNNSAERRSSEPCRGEEKANNRSPGQLIMTDADILSFMDLYGIDLRQWHFHHSSAANNCPSVPTESTSPSKPPYTSFANPWSPFGWTPPVHCCPTAWLNGYSGLPLRETPMMTGREMDDFRKYFNFDLRNCMMHHASTWRNFLFS